MPVLMSFFLFIALSSLALPPLNGFIGEFLILIGTFPGTSPVGFVGRERRGPLRDLSAVGLPARGARRSHRRKESHAAGRFAPRDASFSSPWRVAILFMGIASPLFTRRMAASVDNILEQTSMRSRSVVIALARHLLPGPARRHPRRQRDRCPASACRKAGAAVMHLPHEQYANHRPPLPRKSSSARSAF